MERGIRLILALKSHKALPTLTFPMVQGIVKAPGSFYLGGRGVTPYFIIFFYFVEFSFFFVIFYLNNCGVSFCVMC